MRKSRRGKRSSATRRTGSRRKGPSLLAYRISLILLFCLFSVPLVVLAFVRKSSQVEITLRVTRMSFKVGDQRINRLFNSITAKSIALSQFDRVTFDRGKLKITEKTDEAGEPTGWREASQLNGNAIQITAKQSFASVVLDLVTLNFLSIQPESAATLSWSEDEPNSLKISLDKSATGEIAAEKTLQFSCTGCEVEGLTASQNFPSLFLRVSNEGQQGQIITFQGRKDLTIIALDLAPNTRLKEQSIAVHEKLDFTQRQEDRLVSTVIGGKIRFEGLDKEIDLGEGTLVKLDSLKNTVIRTLGVDNGINVTLNGEAGELLTGVEGTMYNRLPSYLEWAYAQKTWMLVVSALPLIATSLLSVLAWLKIFPREVENHD